MGAILCAIWLAAAINAVVGDFLALQSPDFDLPDLGRSNGVGVAECRSGTELAAAFDNTTVQMALVPVDITLDPGDWVSYTEPVILDRNFTVHGAYEEPGSWPLLDMAFVRNKVQLGPGVVLSFARIVLRRFRSAPQFQAPGMDILLGSRPPPGDGTAPRPGMVFLWGAAIVLRVCLPEDQQNTSVVSLPRPSAELPGQQRQTRLPPLPGCVNNSSGVPPLQRCWPAIGWYQDLATYGQEPDAYQNSVPSGYLLWLYQTYYLCEAMMSEDCIAQYGTVGCFRRISTAAPESGNAASLTPPSGPAAVGSAERAPLAPLLGGLLGGLLTLLAVTLVVMALVARRKRRQRQISKCREFIHLASLTGGQVCTSAQELAVAQAAAGRHPRRRSTSSNPTEGSMSAPTRQPLPMADVYSEPSLFHMLELLPVTPLTPVAPDVNLDLRLRIGPSTSPGDGSGGGREVELLPDTLGRGAMGRVVLGLYRGERVAVKLLNAGMERATPPALVAAAAAATAATATRPAGSRGEGAAAAAGEASVAGALSAAEAGLCAGGGAGAGQVRAEARCLEAANGQPAGPPRALETGPATAANRALTQEVEVLARCQHPNVIRLFAASLKPPVVCLVMELMDTSLDRMLYSGGRQEIGLLPMCKVVHIALQVAQALAYLHPTVLHRDLKPANILVSRADSALPVVKLADFGLSRLRNTALVTRHPDVGTAPYMAPEAFEVDNFTITDRADVYAFGVILWEMLSGTRPWRGFQFIQVAIAVSMHGKRLNMDALPPERCPPELRGLIAACWDADPARRPAAAEIVKSLLMVRGRASSGQSGESGVLREAIE